MTDNQTAMTNPITIDEILNQFIDDWEKLDSTEVYTPVFDKAKTAIQTAVLAAAPKKGVSDNDFIDGFNTGIDMYTKALQQLFESEG